MALRPHYQKRKMLRRSAGLTLIRDLGHGRELLRADAPEASTAQARKLAALPDVAWVSPEYHRQALLTPNDPLYQAGASPADQTYLYDGPYSVQAPAAWDTTVGSSATVIAIIDTGVLPNHPDLRDRSIDTLGYDFVSADQPGDYSSANDGDGRDNNPTDPGDPCGLNPSSWHGTAVASAAAGSSNDAIGLTGVDWTARLLHARALGICGGTDTDIIDAMRWSAGLSVNGVATNANPATVINLSLGGETPCTLAWQRAIDEVTAAGVTVVMAAGNTGNNALRTSPANCARVLSVGSSTPNGDIDTGFSDYGLKVAIAAPGRNILTASNSGSSEPAADGDTYRAETGTSFSASLVSGAIGLVKSINPDLQPAEIDALLRASATPFASPSSCDDYYCGGGVLNIAAAVQQAGSGIPDAVTERAIVAQAAQPLPLSVATSDTVGGYRDIRYFSIDADQSGQLLVTSDADTDLYGYLLNEDMSVLAIDNNSGPELNFQLTSPVEPGRYYLAVERNIHRPFDNEATFSVIARINNASPDEFSFTAAQNAATSTSIQSNTVTLAGLAGETPLTIDNGNYSLNGEKFINTPTTVNNGDELTIVVRSAPQSLTTTSALVTIGTFSTTFSVTTRTLAGGAASGGGGCSLAAGAGRFDPLLPLMLLLSLAAGHRLRRRAPPRRQAAAQALPDSG